MKKPGILITQQKPEEAPFDVRHHRIIRYTTTRKGLRAFRDDLCEALNEMDRSGMLG